MAVGVGPVRGSAVHNPALNSGSAKRNAAVGWQSAHDGNTESPSRTRTGYILYPPRARADRHTWKGVVEMIHSSRKPDRRSPVITALQAAKIKAMLAKGILQHKIAAMFDINQGRVSEINTGKRFAEVEPFRGPLF